MIEILRCQHTATNKFQIIDFRTVETVTGVIVKETPSTTTNSITFTKRRVLTNSTQGASAEKMSAKADLDIAAAGAHVRAPWICAPHSESRTRVIETSPEISVIETRNSRNRTRRTQNHRATEPWIGVITGRKGVIIFVRSR